MTVDQYRVKEKLKEAICNLYNTEIAFAKEVSVKGLIGLTLDKESILMVEIDEILSRDAPDSLNQDGKIQVSLKTTAKAKHDNSSKRPGGLNLNDNCKRQKICLQGNEPPSILSALTKVDPYLSNKYIENGIAHKHQVNSGFTTLPSLADSIIHCDNASGEGFEGNQNEFNHVVEVKNEPSSDDDEEGDAQMKPECDEVKREVIKEKPVQSNNASSPNSAQSELSREKVNGSDQLAGMNMFVNMYNVKNPVYTPYQGVHHRYQIENDSGMTKKLYHCDQCNFSSTWPSNLKRHRQKHLDPDHRPAISHFCEKCDYKTGWASNLRRHLRTVHGENQERTYECPSCCLVQIAKEEPVTCKKCGMLFSSSSLAYKEHVQSIVRKQMNATDPASANSVVQQIKISVLKGAWQDLDEKEALLNSDENSPSLQETFGNKPTASFFENLTPGVKGERNGIIGAHFLPPAVMGQNEDAASSVQDNCWGGAENSDINGNGPENREEETKNLDFHADSNAAAKSVPHR